MPAGMATAATATAVLPPHATTVAMKTSVTAMVGAQRAINNQQSTKSSDGKGDGNGDNDWDGNVDESGRGTRRE
jgi:hypothetical protein